MFKDKILKFFNTIVSIVKKLFVVSAIAVISFFAYNFYNSKHSKVVIAVGNSSTSDREESVSSNLSSNINDEIFTEIKKLKEHHEIAEANLEIIKNKVSSVQEDMKEFKNVKNLCPLQSEHEKLAMLSFKIVKNIGYSNDLSYELKDLRGILNNNPSLKKCFTFDASNLATFENLNQFLLTIKMTLRDRYINQSELLSDKVFNFLKYYTRNMDNESANRFLKIEHLKRIVASKDVNEVCKYYLQNSDIFILEDYKTKLSNTCQAYYIDSCIIQFSKK